MAAEKFMQLVQENRGFEFVQAYREDVDHFLGGKGNVFWYCILKNGKNKESYVGTLDGGVWTDVLIKGSGVRQTRKSLPAGSTIRLLEERAYLAQEETWVKDRKPRLIADSHPHFHYVYGFGDKAADVSEQYGVTIGYSDIKDLSVGFHLRDLTIGDAVELPER